MAKESSAGGFVRPEVRVISKENAWEARDIDIGEGVPSVKEPVNGRLDLWTSEEGVGDRNPPLCESICKPGRSRQPVLLSVALNSLGV